MRPAIPDREAQFSVADPGKAWRRGHRIPVVPSFDGYRAYAILGIVLFHVFQVSGVYAAAGSSALGVILWGVLPRCLDALFIISGFVIYLPTAARGGNFGPISSFAIRRVCRLVPAYYLALLISALLLATVPDSGGLPGFGSIGAHLTMMQTPALLLADNFKLGFGVIPPVWTLSVEAGLYITVPLIAAQYFRHPLAGLLVAAGIVVAWRELALHAGDLTTFVGTSLSPDAEGRIDTYYASQFPSWALAFACGMTGAWAYVRLRDRFPARSLQRGALWVLVAALAVLGLFIYLAGHDAVTDVSPFRGLYARQPIAIALGYPFFLAAVLICLALTAERIQRPVTASPVRWIGDISYTIYLIHFAVIWFALRELSLPQLGNLGSALAWSAFVFPLAIAYAYMSARFLERPIRRWAQRYGRRAQEARELRATAVGH